MVPPKDILASFHPNSPQYQRHTLLIMAATQSNLPHRGTGLSEDAVPDTDPSDVRKTFPTRLERAEYK